MKDTKEAIEAWLLNEGYEFEWDRKQNPSGIKLYVQPNGPRILILTSAIEDNNAKAICGALANHFKDKLGTEGSWRVKSDLKIVGAE